jgi:muramoyltetrapeptide carboxypeptidase LdcA involved in peptidoglycan recycling
MVENFVVPPGLEKGDKVAVVATSAGIKDRFPAAFEKGLERLEQRFGFEPVVYDTAGKDTEYLNGNPQEKAEEFMQAFEDPEIKAVIPVTGGDEQMRILKYLNPKRLKNNPTRFYGISDNTNLHIYLWCLGIQSFYAGQLVTDLMCGGELGEHTYEHLEKAFFEDSLGKVEPSDRFADGAIDIAADKIVDDRERYDSPGWEFWNFEDETVEGRVFGGCFEIVNWQVAAREYMPEPEELEGAVLALETSEEAPSETEVKRCLMCMGESGILERFSAILVGRPVREPFHGEERTEQQKQEYHQKQKDRIKKEIQRYSPETPVVFDVDFGHTDPKIPLQLGGTVEIKPENKTIEFQENGR